MRFPRRALITTTAGLACVAAHLLGADPALASNNQVAIIEDDSYLLASPASTYSTLQTFHKLGASMVRVFVAWSAITQDPTSSTPPANFDATDPAAYPAGAWDRWDTAVRDAKKIGIGIDFTVAGGAPEWANRPGIPSSAAGNLQRAWYPSASAYGQFVHAVGTRYSGNYPDPENPGQTLPKVSFWSIWNEPNFGEDLGPQAINGSKTSVAPGMYRGLVDAAWNAFQATGHSHDKIVIGELAARGLSGKATHKHPEGLPGDFAQTKPMQFVRTLYCLDSHSHRLKGSTARAEGCPTGGSASSFRNAHPGLFKASGFSDHPYPQDQPPTKDRSKDKDFATFSELPNLWAQLDAAVKVYGSHTKYSIYNDEYGYITHPPNKGQFVSPAKAAYYINWAEYLSWKTHRIASTMQYLLYDPAPSPLQPQGGFASGLLTSKGKKKATFDAYRLPVYMPNTTSRHHGQLEIWGAARPAPGISHDTHKSQSVQIQESRSHGSFKTIKTVSISSGRGYFDLRMKFPGSGTVRLAWTYPGSDDLLPPDALGATVHSRGVHVTVK
jgi:hypothetical protein